MSAPMKLLKSFQKLISTNIRQINTLSSKEICYIHFIANQRTRQYLSFNCQTPNLHQGTFFGKTSLRNRRNYSLQHRECWRCGKPTNTKEDIFFCKCGVVQSVHSLSYFEIMSLEDSFDVDTAVLSQKYKELQKLLHPDKHTLKSEEEKILFEEQSSLVNKAYSALVKPLNRALYMLEQAGHPIEEQNSNVDQEFLMEIMEINEDIADADSPESLKPIEIINKKRLDDNISQVSKAFQEGDITAAKQLVIKLKYFTNIDDKIKDIYRGQF